MYLLDPLFSQIKSSNQGLGSDVQFGVLSKVSFKFSVFSFSYFCQKFNRIKFGACSSFLVVTPLTLLCMCFHVIQSLAPSDVNLSAAIVGSQTLSLPKDSQTKLASVSGSHRENWAESSMAEGSPRTDTSTDDTDDRNQRVIFTCIIQESG